MTAIMGWAGHGRDMGKPEGRSTEKKIILKLI
jgi:hypothetical protein